MNRLTRTCSSLNGGIIAAHRKMHYQYAQRISRSVKAGDEMEFDQIEHAWCAHCLSRSQPYLTYVNEY